MSARTGFHMNNDSYITQRSPLRIVTNHFQAESNTPKGSTSASFLQTSLKTSSIQNQRKENQSFAFREEKNLDDMLSPIQKNQQESKKLTSISMQPLDQELWFSETNCCVCEREFDKFEGVSNHHCRACGHGVCGKCSVGKINENRVCDLCFKKESIPFIEQMKKDKLEEKDFITNDSQSKLEAKKIEYNEAQNANKDYHQETLKKQEELKRYIAVIQKQRDTEKEIHEQIQDKNQDLKKNIKRNDEFILKKQAKLNEIKLQISALKLEISQKSSILEEKQQSFQILFDKKNSLIASHNHLIEEIEQIQVGSFRYTRKYSLLPCGQTRKYSLSSQPFEL